MGICPRVHDFSCNERKLSVALGNSLADVMAFSSVPLSQLESFVQDKKKGLDAFVENKKPKKTISSQMPIDLSRHKYANTIVAHEIIDRVKNDIKDYAKKKNTERI